MEITVGLLIAMVVVVSLAVLVAYLSPCQPHGTLPLPPRGRYRPMPDHMRYGPRPKASPAPPPPKWHECPNCGAKHA